MLLSFKYGFLFSHKLYCTIHYFSITLKPMLVGGLLDQTSSTLTQPDMDFSMQWGLGENLADCLYIRPTDRGESGQYTLQVLLSCHLLFSPCP